MRERVIHHGLGSRGALHVMTALSHLSGRPFSPTLVTLVWERPRADALASPFEGNSAAFPPRREPDEENDDAALIADLAEIERRRA